jgi:hypothetical protein
MKHFRKELQSVIDLTVCSEIKTITEDIIYCVRLELIDRDDADIETLDCHIKYIESVMEIMDKKTFDYDYSVMCVLLKTMIKWKNSMQWLEKTLPKNDDKARNL